MEIYSWNEEFSIHASAKEATYEHSLPNISWLFNPRLREGGDIQCMVDMGYITFSIHASAKEATISICNTYNSYYLFNPRLREGGDVIQGVNKQKKNANFQSTPPRRRRRIIKVFLLPYHIFNPRLREGGDKNVPSERFILIFSIHASAKEATPTILYRVHNISFFNPRLREGGD